MRNSDALGLHFENELLLAICALSLYKKNVVDWDEPIVVVLVVARPVFPKGCSQFGPSFEQEQIPMSVNFIVLYVDKKTLR